METNPEQNNHETETPTTEQPEIDDECSQEEQEMKQLEEELKAAREITEKDANSEQITDQQQPNPENPDVKAKLERLRLLRQNKKERKRARKLQGKPEDPDLKRILEELETSFDGKEFQVLIRVLQPPVKLLKERYYEIRNDLRAAITRYYPQVDIKLFGSCVTDLIFDNSDFDFFVDVPTNEDNLSKLNRIHRLICNSKAFARPIKISRARTPLIKVTHVASKTQMDINVSNPLGVFNSEFLRFALSFDPRIKPLAICIKYWARLHHLCGTNLMSNYCLVNLLLFYLMNLRDPLFPAIGILQNRVPEYYIGPWNLAFDAHFPNTTNCMSSLIELLEGFFQYYENFSFETVVVCLFSGKAYPRKVFEESRGLIMEADRYQMARRRYDLQPFTTTTPICVQDPFELNCNIGNSVNANTFKRFRDYCQLAVQIFKEFPSETCRASIILKKLFTSVTSVQQPVSLLDMINNPTSKQVCKFQPMQHELTAFTKLFEAKNLDNTEFNRKKFWCEQMVELLQKMFKEVYLVNLFPFELKRSTSVGHVTLCDYQIRLRANTWSNRGKLEFIDRAGYDREIALSKELKEKSPQMYLDAEITIQAKRERDYIEIELQELSGLEDKQKLLKEFFEETILASTRSFVKSYMSMTAAEEQTEEIKNTEENQNGDEKVEETENNEVMKAENGS